MYAWNGTGTGSGSGLSMSSSQINQIGGLTGSNLGSVSFTTGALLSGSLSGGGTFGAGTITITASGWNGFSGTLFSGTFGSSSSPLQWTALGKIGSVYEYELSGSALGIFAGSSQGRQATVQLFFSSTTPYSGGALSLVNGSAQVVTPEPANVGLLATGLLAMGFVARRKAKRGRSETPAAA